MTKQEFKNTVFIFSEKIYPLVARMLGSMEAEDAIQEIMVKLWHKRMVIKDHPNLVGLIFLTARNHCIDVLRKKPRVVALDDVRSVNHVVNSEHSKMESEELHKIIKLILKKLPEQQRAVFEMRDLDGYETHEIAGALNIKMEHVRVLLSRARKQLRIELETNYKYENGVYK